MRRKFIDGVISQSDKIYLEHLIQYNKILGQRNALLKYFSNQNTFDINALEVYNEQLSDLGAKIHQKRKAFIEAFIPVFLKQYKAISNQNEMVSLEYKSQLNNQSLEILLKSQINKDRVIKYTSLCIHKDDI